MGELRLSIAVCRLSIEYYDTRYVDVMEKAACSTLKFLIMQKS